MGFSDDPLDPQLASSLHQTDMLPNPTPQIQLPTPQMDPPPYEDSFSDLDPDEFGDDEGPHQPLTLTINNASSVHGSNNLVQTPPPPFSEISALSTAVLQAMKEVITSTNLSTATTPGRRQRILKVDLTINCGISVIGDRNVVGGIGLRHKGATTAIAPGSSSAVADSTAAAGDAASLGAKRKAEDVSIPRDLCFSPYFG